GIIGVRVMQTVVTRALQVGRASQKRTRPSRYHPANVSTRSERMPDKPSVPALPPSTHPPDDLRRKLTPARPDSDENVRHIGLVGDTYTILLTGNDTAGQFCLIDMHIPPGGGPPPH